MVSNQSLFKLTGDEDANVDAAASGWSGVHAGVTACCGLGSREGFFPLTPSLLPQFPVLLLLYSLVRFFFLFVSSSLQPSTPRL